MNAERRKSYVKRIITIYIISTAIYFQFIFRESLLSIVSIIVFGYKHLWYLSALAIGLLLINIADKILQDRKYYLILTLLGGILIDEYYKLFNIPILEKGVDIVEYIGESRHAFFFAMPMFLIGGLIAKREGGFLPYRRIIYLVICILLFVMGFVEAMVLKNFIGTEITTDVSVFGWTPAVPLFLICLSTKVMLQIDKLRQLRKTTDVVYIIHVWVITIVQRFSEAKSIWRFLMVTGISFIIALIIVLPIKKAKNGNGKIMSVKL